MKHIVDSDWTIAPPSASELASIAEILERNTGILLASGKQSMVQARLSKRMKAIGVQSFADYIRLLRDPTKRDELQHLISALTTNVTHFFREKHHFEALQNVALKSLASAQGSRPSVRVWSAGCSKGHEPYSLAMTLRDAFPPNVTPDIRILASDIDRKILDFAQAGEYGPEDLSPVSEAQKKKYFLKKDGRFEVKDELRRMVSFKEINLNAEWPAIGKFHVIFCRNVVIYFSPETQGQLWTKFARALEPDGWMFIGHSERIPTGPGTPFIPAGVTTYRLQSSAARTA